ncbi:5-(carboxyamino)imidazole ribonucleotide mutase [Prochlorococcus sp. MIT 1307]|uniref:5-(carboxyamino)imidazole ribonucleotide mutase n=1 Tax=Prochlorococcus sp. MIT 1307 TaxID=3096219 RepID=UPI002A7524D0|nr:5-(carboxyamino)imidazole ribonucleotide mutase [Prochlorococcus sp. MIT 1307]
MNSASGQLSSAKAELPTQVAVVMGSDSDLETLKPAIEVLTHFGLNAEVRILSAHRTPLEMMKFAQEAEKNGLKVIIAGAGGAAHLPGMIASLTTIPVIGVPVKSQSLSGVDSMYSILQMPGGIPVATVAIGGGLNAGLLAAQILGTFNSKINKQVAQYRQSMHNQVVSKDKKIQALGAIEYLSQK